MAKSQGKNSFRDLPIEELGEIRDSINKHTSALFKHIGALDKDEREALDGRLHEQVFKIAGEVLTPQLGFKLGLMLANTADATLGDVYGKFKFLERVAQPPMGALQDAIDENKAEALLDLGQVFQMIYLSATAIRKSVFSLDQVTKLFFKTFFLAAWYDLKVQGEVPLAPDETKEGVYELFQYYYQEVLANLVVNYLDETEFVFGGTTGDKPEEEKEEA